MRGVVYLGDSEVDVMTFDDPRPGERDVVLEMKVSGLCGSDLYFYNAPRGPDGFSSMTPAKSGRPIIGGHEPCGVVVERGTGVSEAEAPTGQRVMVFHYSGCGLCDHCRSGWTQMCPTVEAMYGITADGGHAEYIVVPAETLVPLPDELSFEVGAALACGTGTAWGGLVRIDVSGRDVLAVFGQGPVGLSSTLLAKAMGAQVIAIDISAQRLQSARDAGADVVIDASAVDPVEAIMDLTEGKGVTKSLDASGTEQGRLQALAATRAWGSIAFVGFPGTATIDVPQLIQRQHTLVGSWTFSKVGLAECARFVARRQVPIDSLVTVRGSLDDASDMYRILHGKTSGKGVFVL